eukprot:scaffold918_cov126-Cylindrotheca_fusiformis.AAC.38
MTRRRRHHHHHEEEDLPVWIKALGPVVDYFDRSCSSHIDKIECGGDDQSMADMTVSTCSTRSTFLSNDRRQRSLQKAFSTCSTRASHRSKDVSRKPPPPRKCIVGRLHAREPTMETDASSFSDESNSIRADSTTSSFSTTPSVEAKQEQPLAWTPSPIKFEPVHQADKDMVVSQGLARCRKLQYHGFPKSKVRQVKHKRTSCKIVKADMMDVDSLGLSPTESSSPTVAKKQTVYFAETSSSPTVHQSHMFLKSLRRFNAFRR